ncbi:YlxM family DNA-binding protein [Orenia metallireducens]|uniref:YlxM family DNA-binding protein n=1 Tax=Orenia metallireducens TaxID=1413210 RepID=UPI001FE16142|nr:YlxM family DNA-binding protein [Orenia metallireducens]
MILLLNIDKVVRVARLFSFYAPLLTERQQEFIRLYYHHDLSLGEIAEQQGISRQAVYDNLKRSEESLEDYEGKLQLLKYYDSIRDELDKLNNIVDNIEPRLEEDDVRELKDVLARLQAYQEGELM